MFNLLIRAITSQMIIRDNPPVQRSIYLKADGIYHEAGWAPQGVSPLIGLQRKCKGTKLITSQLTLMSCICLITPNMRKAEGIRRTGVHMIMILTPWATAFQMSVVTCLTMQAMRSFTFCWSSRISWRQFFEYLYNYRSNLCFFPYHLSRTTFWGIRKPICHLQ